MPKEFHKEEFDPSTRLKLDVFRRYVRYWIPTFLTENKDRGNFQRMCLFDLFSGPGKDTANNSGTPIIIYEELQQYCCKNSHLKSSNVKVELFFNDIEKSNTDTLKEHLGAIRCQKDCCQYHVFNAPFEELLKTETINSPLVSQNTACLVILDQFGIKHVDKDVFQFLSKCPTTDIMFFISSSFVKRFANEPSFNARLPIQPERIKKTDIKNIHREICECYKSLIPPNTEYYLSHFSILKESNIYGIIFGSSNLRGLDKFLNVAWELDKETGEANYDIDNDPIRKNKGNKLLFDEMNSYKKLDLFETELKNLLIADQMSNIQIYRFCLEHGFLPKHAKENLKKWHNQNVLDITVLDSGVRLRKGNYYIGWEYYKHNDQKLMFRIKE